MMKRVLIDAVKYGRRVFDGVLQKGEAEATRQGPKQRDFGSKGERELPIVRATPRGQAGVAHRVATANNQGLLARYLARNPNKSLATELRRQFGFRLQSGSSSLGLGTTSRSLSQRLAMYGFVTIGMATGTQLNSHCISYDGVCDQIRGMFKEQNGNNEKNTIQECFGNSYDNYEIGPLIAKGCNAAVHEAKLKVEDSVHIPNAVMSSSIITIDEEEDEENMTDRDTDDLASLSSYHSDFEIISEPPEDETAPTEWQIEINDDIELLSIGSGAEVSPTSQSPGMANLPTDVDYDLAIKMMFNYNAESNAHSILQMMEKELVPSKMGNTLMQMDKWENGNHPKKKKLPPHPNIVEMAGAFVDEVPALPEAYTEYPLALPSRLNPDGCGRNQTMFLVMKKYDMTLREYLEKEHALTNINKSTVLLAQLVEAVVHMNKHGVAHRDLKSDNILLDMTSDIPHLVVSDFGCCLVQEGGSMWLPYHTSEIDKGGNGSLRAPEIANAKPGWLSCLNYSKADLWAVGALSYEIFGVQNPFYWSKTNRSPLLSEMYREKDLPPLPVTTPKYVRAIVKMMLRKKPSQRPDAETIACMLHFVLWAPSHWLVSLERARSTRPPSKIKIMRWILTLATKAILEGHVQGQRGKVEPQLQQLFLSRLNLNHLLMSVNKLWEACRRL